MCVLSFHTLSGRGRLTGAYLLERVGPDFDYQQYGSAPQRSEDPQAGDMEGPLRETAKGCANDPRTHPKPEQDCLLSDDGPHMEKITTYRGRGEFCNALVAD